MESRSMIPNPKDSFDGIGEPLLPFGADWQIRLGQLNYAQCLVALDTCVNGLAPLVNGMLGPFSPPTLSPRCIAVSGLPIAGRNCGIMMTTFAGCLSPEKAKYGWDAVFF
jgi:hypothetical protein